MTITDVGGEIRIEIRIAVGFQNIQMMQLIQFGLLWININGCLFIKILNHLGKVHRLNPANVALLFNFI